MSVRTEKVASVIKRALAMPLSNLAHEVEGGMVSITEVRLSPDLRIATLYLSIFGGKTPPASVLLELQQRQSELRHSLAGSVRLRFVPELRFFLDDRVDAIKHIEKLLEQAKQSTAQPTSEQEE
jgi:ribosome-binding factor A